jgi:hypothetical protein
MSSNSMKVCIIAGGIDARAGGEIITLSTARGARPYFLSCGKILEFTRAAPAIAAPSSWFVDDAIAADGALLIASPVDLLFFLLPLLEAGGTRWSSAGQLLVGAGSGTSALASATGIWERVAAVCDTYGEGAIVDADALVRLNQKKVLALLTAKVRRVAETLDTASRSRTKSRVMIGSSAGFCVDSSSGAGAGAGAAAAAAVTSSSSAEVDILAPPPPRAELINALSIIEDFLSDSWVSLLSVELG